MAIEIAVPASLPCCQTVTVEAEPGVIRDERCKEPAVTAFVFGIMGLAASMVHPHPVLLIESRGFCARHDIHPLELIQSISRGPAPEGKQCSIPKCVRTAVTEIECQVVGEAQALTPEPKTITATFSFYLCKDDDINPDTLQQQVNRLPAKQVGIAVGSA